MEADSVEADSVKLAELDDARLLELVGKDDRDALETLYRRHAPWLIVRLHRRAADPGVVDEVVQDTFLALWRSASAYRGDGDVAAWLWGIAARRLVDIFRHAQRHGLVLAEERVPRSVEEQILLASERADLARALGRLSPELRAVLQATVLDGLSVKETSRLLGIPSGTVKSRAYRARLALRESLA